MKSTGKHSNAHAMKPSAAHDDASNEHGEAQQRILENLAMVEGTIDAHFDDSDPARAGVKRLIAEVFEDLSVLGALHDDDAAPKSGPAATKRTMIDLLQSELSCITDELRETTRKEIDNLVGVVNEGLGFEGHTMPSTSQARLDLRDIAYAHAMRALQSARHIEQLVESVQRSANEVAKERAQ